MFRNLFRFMLVVLALALLRYAVVMISNAVSGSRRKGQTAGHPPSPPPSGTIPTAGSLKKDPVCGTFIAEASSIKETIGGRTVHFCSADCRDKFHQST
jgi:YHS domain-containing protein